MKKRHFLMLLIGLCMALTLIPAAAFATAGDIFETGGLRYKVLTEPEGDKPGTVEVAPAADGNPYKAGSYEIPGAVSNEGKDYQVTHIGDYAFSGCESLRSVTIGGGNVKDIGKSAFEKSGITAITIPDSVTSIGDYAFKECKVLSSVTMGENVRQIGASAFEDSGITSITIPDKVRTINAYTFSGCTSLRSVTMGENVGRIGASAFKNSGITSITIPDSVIVIDAYAFSGCTSLSSVKLGKMIETIGASAFEEIAITSITIPDSVTSIGDSAFANCTFLSSVTMGENVIKIGARAFEEIAITSITIPDSVTSIGDYTFYKCTSLSSVTMGENVIKIGASAFEDSGITSITIPDSVTRIGDGAFANCTFLSSVTMGENVTQIGARAFEDIAITSITIPDSVTSIGDYAFKECKVLSSVTMGENVEEIGSSAFEDSGITSITIPDSVTDIGTTAFYKCAKLSSVKLGEKITSIGVRAFANSGITSITIPDSVLSIDAYTFSGCTSLSSVKFGKKIKTIGMFAFYKCANLSSVIMGENVKQIGNCAFANSGIKAITIPDSVTDIGTRTFHKCVKLSSVELGKQITSIGNNAFEEIAITSIIIPDSVTSIGAYAFNNCKDLSSVTMGKSVKQIGKFAFAGIAIESIILPNSVTSIGDSAFYACKSLASVKTGNLVSKIGASAFEQCAITSITIPNNVSSIGDNAFKDCNSLESITIGKQVKSIGEGAFAGLNEKRLVTVSFGSNNIHNTPSWGRHLSDIFGQTNYQFVIGGGSINIPELAPVKNKEGTVVHMNTFKLKDLYTGNSLANTAITSIEVQDAAGTAISYDMTGVKTDRFSNLYLWLPAGSIVQNITTTEKGEFRYYPGQPSDWTVGTFTTPAEPAPTKQIFFYPYDADKSWITSEVIGASGVVCVIYSKDRGSGEKGELADPVVSGEVDKDYQVLVAGVDKEHTISGVYLNGTGLDKGSNDTIGTDDGTEYSGPTYAFKMPDGHAHILVEIAGQNEKVQLTSPSGLTWNDTKAVWDPVTRATGYLVQLQKDGQSSGEPVTVSAGTEYDFATQLKAGGAASYTFTVQASGAEIYSPSVSKVGSGTYVVLSPPEDPAWDGASPGKAVWESVPNSDGYVVRLYKAGEPEQQVGGDIVVTEGTEYDLGSVIEAAGAGTYTFTVTARGAGPNDSGESIYGDSAASGRSAGYSYKGTPPSGQIQIGTDTWEELAGYLTFDRFFARPQEVVLSGQDDPAETVRIEYHLHEDDTALTQADLEQLPADQWQTYQQPFTLSQDGPVTVYARLTDDPGNVTYISSQGLVIDQVAPAIEGATDDGTYTSGREITVTDPYLASVQVNGEEKLAAGETKVVARLSEKGAHQIMATDRAGNRSALKFTITSSPQPQVDPAAVFRSQKPAISLSNTGSTKIKVSWKKVSGASGYTVYRATKKNGKYTKIATTKSLSYTNGDRKTGQKYYYRVTAYAGIDGKTVYSQTSAVKSITAKPAAVKSLKGKAGKKKATLKWKKSSGVSGYAIYRAGSEKGKYKKIGMIKGNKKKTVKYTSKKLKSKKTYYFKVRAYKTVKKKKVYGAYSGVVKVKVK